VVNWTAVGAILGGVAIIEAPVMMGAAAAYRWARSVDRRLDNIEARSYMRRKDDQGREER